MSRFPTSMSWNQSIAADGCTEVNQNINSTSTPHDGGPELDEFSGWPETSHASLANCSTVFVPLHYEPQYKYPLIVWLHSDGYNENQVDHVMPHISLRNYVAAGVRGNRAADSRGHRFDWHSSQAAIDAAHDGVLAAVATVSDKYAIHPNRVILAGYKSGGTMAMRIAMRDPSQFAAVVSIAGRVPTGRSSLANLNSLRRKRLPMLWQWAERSAAFSVDNLREDITTAMMIQAKVEIRQYAGDDEMNTAALSDMNDWIMNHVISGTPVTDSWQSSPIAFSSN